MRFKILAGTHVEGKMPVPLADGTMSAIVPRRFYAKGNIVESDIDLVKRFGDDKFKRMPELGQVEATPSIDTMEENDLRIYCDDNEVDIADCETVEAIRARIHEVEG
jgi:hypothetical protein